MSFGWIAGMAPGVVDSLSAQRSNTYVVLLSVGEPMGHHGGYDGRKIPGVINRSRDP